MAFDPQLLLHALDEAEDFVVVTDDTPTSEDGPLLVYANRSFFRATGFSADELVGRSISAFYSPRNDPRVLQSIARALEERAPNAREMLALRKDGTDFWLEFVAKPFWQHGGREYWLSIGRDITVRRRALSQMALLFAAMEDSSEAVALYEPASGGLELTYENEQSFRSANARLLSLWNGGSDQARSIRSRLESGREVREFFAELDRNGLPRIVQFNARAVRSDLRMEGVVTLERTLAHASNEPSGNYESLLLRIATLLPSLAAADGGDERFAILRAILLDGFDAELYEAQTTASDEIHVAAGANMAQFKLDGRPMIARWDRPLESTALTALRFCIEAAIEQSRLPRSR